MNVREVQKRRKRVPLPSQEQIREIRRSIAVRRVNLETGSVCLLLGGEEFRLQKVNKGVRDKFCMAWEPRKTTLAEFFALRDEAFEQFEQAREAAAKTKGTTNAGSEASISLIPRTA